MAKIKVLSENIANMIAAGEIIDRPASVVKELVENSLDSGSDHIEIQVKGYGKEEISIIDNGHGMGYHDALLAFERHATSKIREASDLEKIHTLGFRGEALPSIASVSALILTTREKEAEIGTRIVINGGKLLKVSEIGAPMGTTVKVSSLFKNIPARRKFLKSNPVEFHHIAQILQQMALSYFQNSFTFSHNGRKIWHLQKASSLKERIQQLFDHEMIEHLLEIEENFESFQIYGYISNVTFMKPNRTFQYLFVNQRAIRNQLLLKAITEGYRHIAPQGQYPVCFLFLTIPPEKVDVNVHPSKTEVKFLNHQEIFTRMVNLFKDRLSHAHQLPHIT